MRVQVIEPQSDQFCDSQAGNEADVEHRTIASSRTRLRIWSVKQGLQFFLIEKVDERLVGLLKWDR
jgi:hypothetical protein